MPFVYSTGNPTFPEIINVEKAVGRGCPNLPDDVKLVQFLLKKVFASPLWKDFLIQRPLTGDCDELTSAWIYLFQCCMRARGGSGVADQRVDRATGMVGPVSGKTYTIVNLNHQFAQGYPLEFGKWVKGTDGVPTGKVVKTI